MWHAERTQIWALHQDSSTHFCSFELGLVFIQQSCIEGKDQSEIPFLSFPLLTTMFLIAA